MSIEWSLGNHYTHAGRDIEKLGLKLHLAIDCPVHFPVHELPKFQCKHGVIFAMFAVEAHEPEALKEYHNLWTSGWAGATSQSNATTAES